MTRRTKTDQVIVYTSAGGRMALRPFCDADDETFRFQFRIALWLPVYEEWAYSAFGNRLSRIDAPYDDTAALAWLLEGEVGHG